MMAVWLYATDGRALYCVYVPTPMPPSVTYAGRLFYWQGGRYVEAAFLAPYVPIYGAAPPAAAHHEAEAAPADVAERTPKDERAP